MKKILQLVIALTVISAVCAAILAFVNSVTRERIAGLTVAKATDAAKAVLPPGVKAVETRPDPEDGGLSVTVGYSDDAKAKVVGYAVPGISPSGYGGDIRLMVGLTADRTVVTYRKLAANETPGLGAKLSDAAFAEQFGGKDGTALKVKKDGGEIDAITGATITSRAVCEAIADACARVDRIEGKAAAPSAAVAAARETAVRKAVGTLQPLTEDLARKVLPSSAATLKQVSAGEGAAFPSYVAKDAAGATVGYAVVGTGTGAGPHGRIVLHLLFGFTADKRPAPQRPQINLNRPDVPMTDMESAQRTAHVQALNDACARVRQLAD